MKDLKEGDENMPDRDEESFEDWLEKATLDEMDAFVEAAKKVRWKAKSKHDTTRIADEGGPRDTLVQKMAAEYLKLRRRPEHREYLMRVTSDGPSSYEDIGSDLGDFSGQRVLALYKKLCPFEYESEKRARR